MRQIRYILSSLMIMFLTGCYPGEDFGINVSMYVEDAKGGLCSADITSCYQIYDGNPLISEVGVCWEETSAGILPTIEKNSKKTDNVTSPYSMFVSNLKETTSYIVRPYMQVDGFIVYGDIYEFKTPSNSLYLPQLGGLKLLKAELDKLSVSSSIVDVPIEYPVTEVGVCYTELSTSNFTSEMTGVKTVKATLADSNFEVDVTGLNFSTTYRMRAYAKNQAGTIYGNIESFRTVGDEYVPQLGEITLVVNKPTYIEVECKVSELLQTDSIVGTFELYKSYDSSKTFDAIITGDVMKARIDVLPSSSYSIIAKAKNKFGIGSSKTFSIKTSGSTEYSPEVSVPIVTDITPYGATVNSTIKIVDSDYKVLSCGFQYTTSASWNNYETKEAVIENDSVLILNISDLKEYTKYFIRTFVKSELGINYSTETNFTTLECKPTISELVVKDMTKTSMNLMSYVKAYDETSSISEAGVQYTKNTSITSGDTKIVGEIIGDSVKTTLSELKKGTSYIMRAYAKVGDKLYYGEPQTIKTKDDADYKPTIDDVVASNVEMTSFDLTSAYMLLDQTYMVSEVGFQYYRTSEPDDVKKGDLYVGIVSDGKISLSVSDLSSGSTYQVRTYVKMNDGTIYYGNTINVTTKKVEDFIGNVIVSDILISSAKFKTSISELPSSYQVTEVGFHYYELSGNYIMKEKKTPVSINNGIIELDVSGLSRSSVHKVRAYIKCSSVMYYGNLSSFTTLSTSDLPSVACDDVTAVNSTSFSVEAVLKVNNEIYPITEAGFLYIKSTSSSALTLNTNNANRKPLAVQDGKIKLAVDGLDKNSTYLVRAYAISGNEVSYNEKTIKVYTDMDKYKPSMETLSVEKTNGEYVASCKATVSQVFPIIDSGFVYSTSTYSPTLESNDGVVSAQISESLISGKISFTKPQTGSTVYYVRAYAKNANGISYSSYKSVTISWND